MTTKPIENHKNPQRKRRRLDARAILTPYERERLERANSFSDCNRHIRFTVRLKTVRAIKDDLPLIFAKSEPRDFVDYSYFYPAMRPNDYAFLRNLMVYYYRYELHRLRVERHQKGLKLTVSFRDAWKPIKETITKAKQDIHRHTKEHWKGAGNV